MPRSDGGAASVNAAGFNTGGGGAERSSATGLVGAGMGGGGLALPVSGSRSGAGAPGLAMIFSASTTKSCQILAGISPPATRSIGLLSSLPTQTPTTMSEVKPTNQASRYSSVVPVLPADRRASRAARPVPSLTTASSSCIIAAQFQ